MRQPQSQLLVFLWKLVLRRCSEGCFLVTLGLAEVAQGLILTCGPLLHVIPHFSFPTFLSLFSFHYQRFKKFFMVSLFNS